MTDGVPDVHMIHAENFTTGYLVGVNFTIITDINPIAVLKLIQTIERSSMRCPVTRDSDGVSTARSTSDGPERWPCIHVHRDSGLKVNCRNVNLRSPGIILSVRDTYSKKKENGSQG